MVYKLKAVARHVGETSNTSAKRLMCWDQGIKPIDLFIFQVQPMHSSLLQSDEIMKEDHKIKIVRSMKIHTPN